MAFLLTIEGGEYTGKTSVVMPALEKFLRDQGRSVKTSREPGGSERAEKLRNDIFKKLQEGISAEEQALLFNQARQVHVEDTVRPFLENSENNNGILIIDRYLDSTRVYQGLEGGVSFDRLKELEEQYVDGFYPDLTIILYFPEEKFKEIFEGRKEKSDFSATHDRAKVMFDDSPLEIQLQRQRYHLQLPDIAKRFGETRAFELVNSAQKPEQVVEDVIQAVKKHLPDI